MKMIKVEPDVSKESCVFFVWPLDIVHVIDEESPFYNMTASDLVKERFELLVVLEGTNETSNMNFQARTSYLPSEILWGHRFESMMLYRQDHNNFQINFSAFHSTYEVDTPVCSARTLQMYRDNLIQNRPKSKQLRRPLSMVNTSVTSNFLMDLKEEVSNPITVSRSMSNTLPSRVRRQMSMPSNQMRMINSPVLPHQQDILSYRNNLPITSQAN